MVIKCSAYFRKSGRLHEEGTAGRVWAEARAESKNAWHLRGAGRRLATAHRHRRTHRRRGAGRRESTSAVFGKGQVRADAGRVCDVRCYRH